MNKLTFKHHALALAAASLLVGCGGKDAIAEEPAVVVAATDAEDLALKFDATKYTTVNITVDGLAVKLRQYRIVYVAKPIKALLTQSNSTLTDANAYQTMIVSVPEDKVGDQKAALYFLVNNSGWMASAVSTTITEGKAFVSTTDTDNVGAALKAGYVFINVGTRSRGIVAEDGRWMGKAPAPVVDAKAAIRYLRLNDTLMPGSAERIVVTGTSGGGGLTAAVSASGNSADFLPFLDEIGAAGITGSGAAATSTIKDDVFAAVAYCPINNLGNADIGYEFEYSAVRSDKNTGALGGVVYSAGQQPAASTAIAAKFAAYVSSLNLKADDGSALTAQGLRDATQAFVKQEIERQIAKGTTVPAIGGNFVTTRGGPGGTTTTTLVNDWLTLSGSSTTATVAGIDYAKFVNYVAANQALKTAVAFDPVGVTGNKNATTGIWNISGETNLFGPADMRYANYSEWSWNNNAALGDGSGTDDTGLSFAQYMALSSTTLGKQIKLINPLAYLNTAADSAPYWYVRHGMVDRDTAFAMQTLLYYAIKSDASVKDLSFKLPYLVGHSGNYDVQEAFAWIKAKLDANP
ncbi:subtype B tannase [Roseateles oligotrophus]|uniref:BD-FAE-like domain-containing protein n=1 Tax=Roseateles oligotrophus TaxID=1769250 RepID=A0ABT2YHR5_9BURK|nr:subtype B tannase [Roseateles oligotrophus]MCV2369603.1 hypothetical protein [Roseateles oligotrophus]